MNTLNIKAKKYKVNCYWSFTTYFKTTKHLEPLLMASFFTIFAV